MKLGRLLLAALILSSACSMSLAQHTFGRDKYPNLTVGGFFNTDFYASDEDGVDSNSGFKLGQFVLHFNSELGSNFRFFGELSFTARDDEYRTEVERAHVIWDSSDFYKISAGRFHTPITWWNTAYHHGLWLQTTIARPVLTRFGGEFVPVHFVGLTVNGAIPSGSAGLQYEAGIGNGRGENIARGGDAGDVNNNRAIVARFTFKPDNAYGLQTGVSFYVDKISQQPLIEDHDEQIVNVFVVWTRENPEVIAEYVWLDREGAVSDMSYSSAAYYVQVAYRLKAWKSRIKPYVRFEDIDVDDLDPVFSEQSDFTQVLVGVRLDVGTLVALKFEARRDQVADLPKVNSVWGQVSLAF
jgi:hypothetical protein